MDKENIDFNDKCFDEIHQDGISIGIAFGLIIAYCITIIAGLIVLIIK
jgi:hypothetical protein